jgi:hypothetical protein
VCALEEAVHCGAGEECVAEERRELFDGAVGGEDRRAVLVALADDLVEVDRLAAGERAEAEVVDDQQVRRREAEESPVVAAVSTGGSQLLEEVMRRHVEHGMAGATGAMPERLREVR